MCRSRPEATLEPSLLAPPSHPTLQTNVAVFLVKLFFCGACSVPVVGLPPLKGFGDGE